MDHRSYNDAIRETVCLSPDDVLKRHTKRTCQYSIIYFIMTHAHFKNVMFSLIRVIIITDVYYNNMLIVNRRHVACIYIYALINQNIIRM